LLGTITRIDVDGGVPYAIPAAPAGEHLYSDFGRSTLVSFGEPYRAAAFVESLAQRAPALQLDWFRTGVGKFAVVLTYRDREHFSSSARLLEGAGFPLD